MSIHSDDDDATAQTFRSLLSVHAAAGRTDASRIPGFAALPLATALETLASAPLKQVSVAARLEALHSLAKADFPQLRGEAAEGYRALAGTIVADRDVDVEQLLADLRSTALVPGGFQRTASRQALLHHEAAFVGEDVCTTRRVTVDGREAVWVFSEFETDAPFEHVATWLDPRNWSNWGHLFFKSMTVVGSDGPIHLPPPGTEHWHAPFREVVQFPWTDLDTVLHCDYWREGDVAAGMTYDLDRSLDSQIDVDRGFILANSVGTPGTAGARPVVRVKVLKIVGFTEDVWDDAAEWVCPFWTEWIRGAVEGASSSRPTSPTQAPGGAGQPGSWQDTAGAWLGFLGDSARPYLDLFGDVGDRLTSQGYDLSACLDDERRYWSMLAKDWARAWAHGISTVDEISRRGFDADFGPPPRPGPTAGGAAPSAGAATDAGATAMPTATAPGAEDEGTLIPVPGLGASDSPVCSDLTSIEAGAATIGSKDVLVTVEPLDQGAYAVRLLSTDATVKPSLYVGTLTIGTGRPVVPVQLYVSRAVRT